MRISDWSSDVCSSDLAAGGAGVRADAVSDAARRPAGEPGRGRHPAGGVRCVGRVRTVPDQRGLMRMRLVTLRANAAQFFADFFRLEAASGILLIVAAVIALVCANTPVNDLYQAFREMPVELRFGALQIDKPLLLWINDGLMALFFLLVALDRKSTRLNSSSCRERVCKNG